MSVMNRNCQGVGSDKTVQRLRSLILRLFPDFVILMETKQKNDFMLGLQESLGYRKMITVEPICLTGGLAMMWKDIYKVKILSSDKRIIDTKVTCGSISFFLTCCMVILSRVKDRRCRSI